MRFVRISAETYSGYRANERPLAFTWAGGRYRVVRVLDRWYQGGRTALDPKLDYFKVLADDGRKFILGYNALFDAWSLMPPSEPLHDPARDGSEEQTDGPFR